MKKPSTTTTLLTTLLIASIAGNAVQLTRAASSQATTIATMPVSDEPQEETAPAPGDPACADENGPAWDTYATFAVTYKVDRKPGLVGGYTVTVYYVDAKPTVLRQEAKPTVADVTWSPSMGGLPGVADIKAVAVQARQDTRRWNW
mgnify:CR=1 FL=1